MSEDIPPRPEGLWSPDVPPPPTEVGARPVAGWRWWEALGVYLIAVIVAGFATFPLLTVVHPPAVSRILTSVVADGLIIAVLLWWLNRFHAGWRASIGFPPRAGPEVRIGIVFGILLYPVVAFGVGAVLVSLLQAISGKGVEAPQQLPSSLDGLRLFLAIVLAVVAAPISEEFFFRGCLFRALRDRFGFVIGAVGSAIVFGLVHYIPGQWQDSVLLMSVMVFTGIGLAFLYERRGNILASMVAHASFNVVALTLILVQR